MTLDRSFIEKNHVATDRMRALVARLSDAELQQPVGQHWTVAIALAHLAFWDRRVMCILETTEREGKLLAQEIDILVNDISLPLFAAIPPRQAATIAIESAEELDARLENFPPRLLAEIYARNDRWVLRDLHRNEHLDEVEAALTR